jgi:hypothetical protein
VQWYSSRRNYAPDARKKSSPTLLRSAARSIGQDVGRADRAGSRAIMQCDRLSQAAAQAHASPASIVVRTGRSAITRDSLRSHLRSAVARKPSLRFLASMPSGLSARAMTHLAAHEPACDQMPHRIVVDRALNLRPRKERRGCPRNSPASQFNGSANFGNAFSRLSRSHVGIVASVGVPGQGRRRIPIPTASKRDALPHAST